MKTALARLFTPHATVPRKDAAIMVAFQVLVALGIWIAWPMKVIPKPMEVIGAFGHLWISYGLGQAMKASFVTCVEAILIATTFSLGLGYLRVLQFFKPAGQLVSKMRFLGLVGLNFIFTLLTGGGHLLKLTVLVFGLSVFMVPSILSIVDSVTKDELDHARTLRMGPWRTVFEVIVLGKADLVLEAIRQNAAIAWMMLTVVEGLVRSEGGVGALLLTQSKFLKLPEIYAIQFSILCIGLLFDQVQVMFKRAVCPWSQLGLEKR
ncbi:nitrate ABC transporter permease [Candidatus Campbellbacteria bacterium]|nr:MAG: nitrate ABC transporter permease [Candidatus Campbellbacteria bacterium]